MSDLHWSALRKSVPLHHAHPQTLVTLRDHLMPYVPEMLDP